MNKKQYIYLATIVFLCAGTLHTLRLLQGWELWLGPYFIHPLVSWTAVIVTALLVYSGYKFTK